MKLVKKISMLLASLILLLILSGVAAAGLIGLGVVAKPSEPITMLLIGSCMVIFAGFGRRNLKK